MAKSASPQGGSAPDVPSEEAIDVVQHRRFRFPEGEGPDIRREDIRAELRAAYEIDLPALRELSNKRIEEAARALGNILAHNPTVQWHERPRALLLELAEAVLFSAVEAGGLEP